MNRRFRQLVEQHKDWVYTFSFYNLGNKEEAEDATQEVLMRLWKNWENLHDKTIGAWVRRVTVNACIDTARRRRAYRARVVASGGVEELAHAVSTAPDPSLCAERAELRESIRAAVSSLGEPYRSIVVLREIQGMRYEEIGESLELPLNTVKSYLFRARRTLRDRLREAVSG